MDPGYEQMVAAAKSYGATVLSAGEKMKRDKQIEVFKRVRGALRITVNDIDAGRSVNLDVFRQALAALDEVLDED